MTLDIETSSIMDERDGGLYPSAVWLSYGVTKVYSYKGEEMEKLRFREWKELHVFLDRISQKLGKFQIICYVHNLGYEFDYLIKNVSLPKQFLTNSSHATISSTLIKYPNIQFRCSYLLTGYSLRKLGEIIGLKKLESDYRQIFPCDKVTKEEWEYCERDNDIVAKYITNVALKEYGILFNIPYTKTGRVRKIFYKFYDELEGKNCTWDSMPTQECIYAMEKAFNGGVVVSNPFFTDIELKNVHSYDITSSYPFAACSEKFPRKIERIKLPKNLDHNKYFIAKIKFKNIRSKYNWQWLSISKMENINDCHFFNGKLIYGKSCERYVTNIDFEIIEMTYSFEYEIIEYYHLSDIDYLPECYIKTIKTIGIKKSRLKQELKKYDELSEEYSSLSIEYMLAKNDFNSIYGMMVEKLIKSEYVIDENFMWHEKKGEYKYKSHIKRNFLFGVYITAYARRNLINAIVKNCSELFVYCDTDSIKFIGENKFINTNKNLCDFMSDCPELSTLGQFEYEGTYDEFKTLGAKKYCYKKQDNIFLVVAGLPKHNGYDIKDVSEFKCGKIFENCKLGKTYLTQTSYTQIDDDEIIKKGDLEIADWLTKNNIKTAGGVGLYPTSYKLDLTENDKYIIIDYRRVLSIWVKKFQHENGIILDDYFRTGALTL